MDRQASAIVPSATLTDRFTRAFEFASVVHVSQLRKGTRIPYIAHLLGVASLVIEHGADEDTAVAALLHDSVEDQGGQAMLEQVRARFGDRVARIVEGCTDTFEDPKPPWVPRKEAYIRHVLADASLEGCMVSAADKLHNARAILHDLRAADDPASVWSRFSAASKQLGWYYGGLERALGCRLETHDSREIVQELRHALDAISSLSSGDDFKSGLHVGRKGGDCPSV